MAKRRLNLRDIKYSGKNCTVTLNFSKYNSRFAKAQESLDIAVMDSMLPFMPHNTGDFQRRTRAESTAMAGTGQVVAAAAPFGRYLYHGKVMVDSKTGRGPAFIPNVGYRFREGATLVATDRPLTYSNPNAKPEWFEVAKRKDLPVWIETVEQEIKGD